MSAQSLNQADGDRRKAEAIALLADRRELYVLRGRRALLSALLATGQATADDVRDVVELPNGINPKCFGAVPSALAREGIIRRVGYVPARRPDAHARPVSVWALVDRDAAMRWLADHPDRPDDQAADQDGPQRLLFPYQETATPAGLTAGAAE